MKQIVGLVLIAVLLPVSYWFGMVDGASPEVVYQAPPDDENLLQWRRDWRKAGNSLIEASIVSDRPDQLLVYVDYIYSGEHGKTATTCGNLWYEGRRGQWTCSPTGIRRGRGFTTLRFQLSSDARAIECSDTIEIDFYDRSGSVFFTKEVPFRKTWVDGGDGFMAEIKQATASCPESN